VITADARLCRGSKYVKVIPPHGFLSNLVASETGCGTVASPWLIEAKAGLRINITLWDFAVATSRVKSHEKKQQQQQQQSMSGGSCLKYATLSETDAHQQSRPKMICSEYSRRRHVYTSLGSSLEIRIHGLPAADKITGPFFLIEYTSNLTRFYLCILLLSVSTKPITYIGYF